jgi:DNA-binding response OmpR family regulator
MKARILIVDDEEPIRFSLGEILKLEGFEVESAASGEAAIEILKNVGFDLVLLDLKMPGVSGLEVLHFINDTIPDTKVILLTAHGSLESAIEALRKGAHDYLLKPANSRSILESIERALARRSEQQRKRLLLEQLDASVQRLLDVEMLENKTVVEQKRMPLEDGIYLDLTRREIWYGDFRVSLTPTEGKLMKTLLDNRGRVLSHKELVFLVQGYETTDLEAPEVLRPIVSRLRRKLALFPAGDEWIHNVRGTGYVLEYPKP